MKVWTVLLWVLATLGLVGFVATFPIEASYAGRAKMVQRVEKSAEAALFNDVGTPIGSPQRLIIDDPKAFVGEPSAEGVHTVSEGYLKENGIYPLQLQTVQFVAGNARLGLGLLAVASAGILFVRSRRSRRK